MSRTPATAGRVKERKVKLLRPCFVNGELENLEATKKDGKKIFKPREITCSVQDARILVNARKAEYADGMGHSARKPEQG